MATLSAEQTLSKIRRMSVKSPLWPMPRVARTTEIRSKQTLCLDLPTLAFCDGFQRSKALRLKLENFASATMRCVSSVSDQSIQYRLPCCVIIVENPAGEKLRWKLRPRFTHFVRRQGFWDRWPPELREDLAHLVGLIMRRICGEASAGFRWSLV